MELPGLDLLFDIADVFHIGVDELLIDTEFVPAVSDIKEIINDDKELIEFNNKIDVLDTKRREKFLEMIEFLANN